MENGLFSQVGSLNIAILLIIGASTLVLVRIMYVIYRSGKPLHSRPPGPLSALIVLGSGGHTAEMLNLLAVMQMDRFKPRYYIAAATDNMSLHKARVMEDSLKNKSRGWSVLHNFSWHNFSCFSPCIMANDQDQTSSDFVQWTWNLYSALSHCFCFQGAWDQVVIHILCREYCQSSKAIFERFASLQITDG